jgi:putative endonuclease
MYTVYVLKSRKNNFIYVGSTEDIDNRIGKHNKGRVKSTKAYIPWELVETRSFSTRSEAVKEELFLKTGQQKELLRKKYCFDV